MDLKKTVEIAHRKGVGTGKERCLCVNEAGYQFQTANVFLCGCVPTGLKIAFACSASFYLFIRFFFAFASSSAASINQAAELPLSSLSVSSARSSSQPPPLPPVPTISSSFAAECWRISRGIAGDSICCCCWR